MYKIYNVGVHFPHYVNLFEMTYTGLFFNNGENSRKLYVADLANDVHCNFPPEALINTVSSYEAAYWLERIAYNFLIWSIDNVNYFCSVIYVSKDERKHVLRIPNW